VSSVGNCATKNGDGAHTSTSVMEIVTMDQVLFCSRSNTINNQLAAMTNIAVATVVAFGNGASAASILQQ